MWAVRLLLECFLALSKIIICQELGITPLDSLNDSLKIPSQCKTKAISDLTILSSDVLKI